MAVVTIGVSGVMTERERLFYARAFEGEVCGDDPAAPPGWALVRRFYAGLDVDLPAACGWPARGWKKVYAPRFGDVILTRAPDGEPGRLGVSAGGPWFLIARPGAATVTEDWDAPPACDQIDSFWRYEGQVEASK